MIGPTLEEVVALMANRRVVVWISFPLLQDIMTVGWKGQNVECIKGIPEGARWVHSYSDFERQIVGLVFEHESFEEVPFGKVPPDLTVVHRTVLSE